MENKRIIFAEASDGEIKKLILENLRNVGNTRLQLVFSTFLSGSQMPILLYLSVTNSFISLKFKYLNRIFKVTIYT